MEKEYQMIRQSQLFHTSCSCYTFLFVALVAAEQSKETVVTLAVDDGEPAAVVEVVVAVGYELNCSFHREGEKDNCY